MRLNHSHIVAAAILMLAAGSLLAMEPTPAPPMGAQASGDEALSLSSPKYFDPSQYDFLRCGAVEPRRDVVERFGWWGVGVDGSPANVGEWQGLDSSSAFWNVDGLMSDGCRTFDFFAAGPESESTRVEAYYYGGPRLTADVDYERFIHRSDHNPLGGLPDADGFPPPGGFFNPPLASGVPGYPMFGEDFNVGQEYAIRVQELKADFKGCITDNVKWRLNLWGMRKEGTRQAESTKHCFRATATSTNTCHVVSNGQHIDWLTMQIEPVIEARFGWLTAEYSRTIRSFQQDDQIVTNDFTGTIGLGAGAGAAAYAYVPENHTEIDRLKLHGQLRPCTELYVNGFVGNTHNDFRDSDRKFYGVDTRLTDTSIDGLALTAYAKTYTENNSPDTTALDTRYPTQTGLWAEANPPQTFYGAADAVDNPYNSIVDRDTTTAGVKARWRPFRDCCDLRRDLGLNGGYEYRDIKRYQVTYFIDTLEEDGVDPPTFTQPSTVSNSFFVGLDQRWSCALDSYIRYRFIESSYPLVGTSPRQQLDLVSAINSNLPEHEDRVEIGGTWTPTDNFLLNASLWIENTYNHSGYVDFDEDNYPFVISAWYAPDCKWSFSGGYASFSNWINQDITLGRQDGSAAGELVAWTTPWDYTGRADVVNVGATYLCNCKLKLIGGFEYVTSRNYFDAPAAPPGGVANADPPPAPATVDTYSDLPGYSRVEVNTTRFTLGFDYAWTDCVDLFFRYNFYDFDNQGAEYEAGTANMALAGVSAVF
jgi:hypothetical protein